MLTHLECTRCDRRYEPGRSTLCECGAALFARYDLPRAALEMRPGHLALREPSLWRYREVLPLEDADDRVSLGEGFTPLLPTPRLGARLSLPKLLVKEEGANPTGSFEARGLALAVSMAKLFAATDVCLPSAANAGCALAAYAARAGLRAHVFLPADTPRLFTMEAQAYGAELVCVAGPVDEAARACAQAARAQGWYTCASFQEPYRIEGKKTMGYELAEQLEWRLPDAILCPVGGGTGIVGIWKAFAEMLEMGFLSSRRPRLYAVQAEGCAPIVKAFSEGQEQATAWDGAETLAHALRVPKPAGDVLILRALRESHGAAVAVSDAEMIQGVKEAALSEGLFLAPEGGACVAAARRLRASGHLSPDDTVVVFDTGSGYKYAESMEPLWHA
jgi:threonine synthase